MLHPSTKRLIDRLCEMTTQRKIEWINGEHPDSLVYDTEGYRVLLEGDPPSLVLCDALGRELERADHAELAATQHLDGGTYEGLLATMREDASRIARGTESAIETVLGGLDLDGDGIPDMPAPEEEMPGSPEDTASAFEDSADEISAAAPEMEASEEPETEFVETEPEPVESDPVEFAEPLPESAPEEIASFEETAPDEPVEMEMEDAVEAAPMVDMDVEETPALEETPDVGKAIADLADRVNQAEAAPVSPTAASNTLLAMQSFADIRPRAKASLSQTPAPTEPDAASTDSAESDAILSQDGIIEPIARMTDMDTNLAAPQIPLPGEVLSLSGLAEGKIVGDASIATEPDTAELAVPEVAAEPVQAEQIEPAETPPPSMLERGVPLPPPEDLIPALQQSAPEAEASEHEATEAAPVSTEKPDIAGDDDTTLANGADPEAEPDDTETKTPKRFNPWI